MEGSSIKHGDEGFESDADYADAYDEGGLPSGQGKVLFGDELPEPEAAPALPQTTEQTAGIIERQEGPAEIIEIKPEEVKAAEAAVLAEVPQEISLEQFDEMNKEEPVAEDAAGDNEDNTPAEEETAEDPSGDGSEPEEDKVPEDKEAVEEPAEEAPEEEKPLTRKQIREEKKRAKAELKQAKKEQKKAKKDKKETEPSSPEEDIDLLGDEDS